MIGYWAPYGLAVAAAMLALVSGLPLAFPELGLRRYYQRVTVAVWALLGVGVGLVVLVSSPWLALGLGLLLALAGVVVTTVQRLAARADDEALDFLQALAGLMASGANLLQALRRAANDQDFAQLYPRLTEQTRQILGYTAAGKPLSEAAALVAEGIAPGPRRIWERIALLARMVEEQHGALPTEIERDTLQSLWSVLHEVRTINADLKREMGQMELAKWVFSIILPGLNLFMARSIPGYMERFLPSPLGLIVLGIEVAALVVIFVTFSRLARLPKVRV